MIRYWESSAPKAAEIVPVAATGRLEKPLPGTWDAVAASDVPLPPRRAAQYPSPRSIAHDPARARLASRPRPQGKGRRPVPRGLFLADTALIRLCGELPLLPPEPVFAPNCVTSLCHRVAQLIQLRDGRGRTSGEQLKVASRSCRDVPPSRASGRRPPELSRRSHRGRRNRGQAVSRPGGPRSGWYVGPRAP
jgi:hypothetical protein